MQTYQGCACLAPEKSREENPKFTFWVIFPAIQPPSPLVSEKAMAPHSSTLAWKIPWMEEPGTLQSMGSIRVGHDWATSLSLFTFMHWRRKWQPTPVFWPGESQGWWSLVGCCLWGCTESDTTEVIYQQQQQEKVTWARNAIMLQMCMENTII